MSARLAHSRPDTGNGDSVALPAVAERHSTSALYVNCMQTDVAAGRRRHRSDDHAGVMRVIGAGWCGAGAVVGVPRALP
jgi:hypothetical protein